jgi:hypothetical protein
MLSDELLHECQGLIYDKWRQAFANLKAIKAAKDNGEPDWEQFHAIQLKNAQAELDRYSRLNEELKPIAPLTRKQP